MSVHVSSNTIPDSETQELITDTVLQGIGVARPGNWRASIEAAGPDWHITIDGPENFHWDRHFRGPHEHRPDVILHSIREVLPAVGVNAG